jgi:hypothetical protein
MKKILITIGVIVGSLYIAGAFGIGTFELHYGAKSMCEARQ